MAKTLPPTSVAVPAAGETFVLNAVPDPFDERDLAYRPRLQPLPARLDQRPGGAEPRLQRGSSCVGHAVATLIDTVMAAASRKGPSSRMSPYMLYRLARRYDEFAGERDEGSSLRGAFKGWFYHGVAPEEAWPDLDREPDLDDPEIVTLCRDCPCGAFYRVDPYRLDDMQSAISELNAVAVSAVIHDGWLKPREVEHGGMALHVIERDGAALLGGHAFALVGYNKIGFLVQNSWGAGWGRGGFATLRYEDWLDSAFDAWVGRPGVPQNPIGSGRKVARGTGAALSTAPGPDLLRLRRHVVNLGNDGRLSGDGRFVSTPRQVDGIFTAMEAAHRRWLDDGTASERHVVLWAHGGLVSEGSGLTIADKHLGWWLENGVYPLTFAWQSGPVETLVDHLVDAIRDRIPFGGIRFDLTEQFDRLVERVARSSFPWMWAEMKENAERASAPLDGAVDWNLGPDGGAALGDLPGASLVADRLRRYLDDHGGAVKVHLVGHSAGSVFHAALLPRLRERTVGVESLAFLAPALRVDAFEDRVLARLGGEVRRFTGFVLSDRRELDDTVGAGGITVYRKSLLYLVSRALERAASGNGGGRAFEVPLVGMERFLDRETGGGGATLRRRIEDAGGEVIVAPAAAPVAGRSDSRTHGGFDDDEATMTSVLLRVLGATRLADRHRYRPHLPVA